ncbi:MULTISPECIES: terminase [unclassified Bacillus (in: firmicutes)]|uniref:terminase n=1 Tax=unclassified Bacillus (in: firmicutes) TaxID=185979 RepID=UPI00227F622C|nr:terminase [Bacillus sp. S20C3]MCY8290277.1 terminase [Bacillus sp. N13C7]MCY8638747.1 terminase [Bacillus sp. S17B2]
MAYEAKTDWLPDDPINEDDVNRWEKGIEEAHKDLAAHKNDMNNPHKVTKEQLDLGNVDNVQQAAKKDFDLHNQDQERHVTNEERAKWNGAQLSKMTKDDGSILINIGQGYDFHSVAIGQKKTFTFYMSSDAINAPPQAVRGIYLCSSSTSGEAMAMATDGGFWRKSLVNGTWSDWIKYETEERSIKRLAVHTDDKDIHVTKSDKDKWNGAQLSKITNDVGGVSFAVNEGEDMLQAIIDRGRSMGTFYANGKAVNSPSTASTRGFYQMTSQSSDGKGSYGWVYAMDYRNNVFTNYWDGNTVGWQGWKKLETETASQEKADKALSDAKAFVQNNFTNQKLTLLTGTNAIQDARTSGESYPLGLTLMDIGQGNTTGYPLRYGIVKNEKFNNSRFTQYFYGTGNESGTYIDSTGVWIRHWWSGSGWTPWEKISGFVHTNIGTTGKQLLIKGEQQKVRFNRKIKDSHNAFDVTNNRFICPNSGMFLVNAGLYIENVQRYANYEMEIYLNGTIYKNIAHYRNSPANPSDSTQFNVGVYGAATVPANAGDYIEIYLYVGYDGDVQRYITDNSGWYNYFDITEMGGRNYPRF